MPTPPPKKRATQPKRYCGWTKSISHHLEIMAETSVCWYLQGESNHSMVSERWCEMDFQKILFGDFPTGRPCLSMPTPPKKNRATQKEYAGVPRSWGKEAGPLGSPGARLSRRSRLSRRASRARGAGLGVKRGTKGTKWETRILGTSILYIYI